MNIRQIGNALRNGNKGNILPEGKRDWDKIKSNLSLSKFVIQIDEKFLEYTTKSVEPLKYSDFIIFETTGSRKEYERVYFNHRMRLNTFAISAMLDPSQEKLELLQNIMWFICDEYTWCLPAHLHGRGRKVHYETNPLNESGIFTGVIPKQVHSVDLFAAETAFALSEILYILEDKLDALVISRVREEIFRRVIYPFMDINRFTHWEESTNNWAAVCAGSVGAAAIYLIDNDQALSSVILRVTSAMESYLDGFEADGACTEGLGYWMYGFGYFTYFAALLKERTSGLIDLFDDDKVRRIMVFPQKCYLSGNCVTSYSDGSLQFMHNPGILHYLKRLNKEIIIPNREYEVGFPNDHCARWANDLRNLIWYNPENDMQKDNDLSAGSFYLESSEWFISRLDNKIAFSTKAGHNGESHNHNDVGSFIYHKDGENYLTDLGAGEYTKEYFGPTRYDFLCNGSQGHSVPIINGCCQAPGREYAGKNMKTESNADTDIVSYQMEAAYDVRDSAGNIQIENLKRSFIFDKSTGKLTLSDDFSLTGKLPLTERFVTQLPVAIENNTVLIKGKETCKISFDEKIVSAKVVEDEFMNHKALAEKVYLIDFELIVPNNEITLSFLFEIV